MPGVLASTLIGNIATMSVYHHGALERRSSTSRSAFKVGWTLTPLWSSGTLFEVLYHYFDGTHVVLRRNV
jgi:hypothetical protein